MSTTETPVPLDARNATLGDLAGLLKIQHDAKLDVVVSATAVSSQDGLLKVKGAGPDGPDSYATFRPTAICDEGIAEKLGIPLPYVRRMRAERPDILDRNVNGWLHGFQVPVDHQPGEEWEMRAPADPRKFLLRCFQAPDFGVGVCRALLSQSYKPIDNLDVLTAALDGIRESGTEVEIQGCDLTERRMSVKIVAPGIQTLAPKLLEGYRPPTGGWSVEGARRAVAAEGRGYEPGKEPILFAGFVLQNSETGGSAFTLVPRIVVQMCSNGLTITRDALRSVHLGSKMEEGIMRWSEDTQRKNLELVTAQARDAVTTFLDVDYVSMVIDELEAKAGRELTDAAATVEFVGKTLKFSQETTAGVLDHFIKGGQMTAGGVMQAVTSFAQTVDDADLSAELEALALQALDVAAAR